jgi:hypothetical protein
MFKLLCIPLVEHRRNLVSSRRVLVRKYLFWLENIFIGPTLLCKALVVHWTISVTLKIGVTDSCNVPLFSENTRTFHCTNNPESTTIA